MAKKKYYAVKQGVKPGIYETWAECEAQTKGFSGAKYKSFGSMAEAEKYMMEEESLASAETNTESNDSAEQINNQVEDELQRLGETEVIAFVDGSYSSTEEKSGFVERFLELSLFYGLSSPLNSEMICIFPYF